jgi:hypothetical protein
MEAVERRTNGRWRSFRLHCVAALCGLLVGCSTKEPGAALTEVDRSDTEPVTLRLNAKKGDRYRYQLLTKMQAVDASGELTWEMQWEQTATEASDDATTWNIRFEIKSIEASGVFKGAESTFRQLDGAEVPVSFDRLGRSLDEEDASGATGNLVFPEHAVRPGDSWKAEMDLNNEIVTASYTFIKRTTHQGAPAILIEGAVDPDDRVRSVKPIRFLADPATGTILEATAEYEFKKPQHIRMRYEIQRL